MFITKDAHFITPATITCPVDEDLLVWDNIRFFDNDGFQLNKIEQAFYVANGIELGYVNNYWGARYDWIVVDHPNFIIDHSMLATRCNYQEAALEQLIRHSTAYPYLKKFTKIRPKWGVDFALEYVDGEDFLEVIHIEYDFADLDQALETKAICHQKIFETDWEHFTQQLIRHKDEWISLEGMDRNDWKAKFWGMAKAESILKVI